MEHPAEEEAGLSNFHTALPRKTLFALGILNGTSQKQARTSDETSGVLRPRLMLRRNEQLRIIARLAHLNYGPGS